MLVGLDMIEIDRISRALERYPRMRQRVFTDAEVDYCEGRGDPVQSYAARFAGKEAVGKALGYGVPFTWRQIEIVGRPKPSVHLSGRMHDVAERLGVTRIDISMTHTKTMAAAVAIVMTDTTMEMP